MAPQGNISQFNSPVDSLKPDEAGAATLARAGREIGSVYNEAGKDIKTGIDNLTGPIAKTIDQHEYMTEVSQGAAAGAAFISNKQSEWDKIASQPGAAHDPDLAKNFMANNFEPDLQNYLDSFTNPKAQEWALNHTDQWREHFSNKTSADMMNIAAEGRVQDVLTQRNQYGAMIQQDPTSFDLVAKQWKSYVEEVRKDGVFETPENSAKLNTLFSEGMDEFGKEQVKAFADKGNFAAATATLTAQGNLGHITPEWQTELGKYIIGAERARRDDADHAYIQQERAQKLKDENFSNGIIDQIKPDANGQINIPPDAMAKIFSAPGASQGGPSGKAKIEAMQMIDHAAKGTAIDNPDVIRQNFSDLNSLTAEDLRKQAASGQITPQTFSFFSERLKQTPDVMAEKSSVSNAIKQTQDAILTAPAPGIPPSPQQRQKQIAFTSWFMPAYTTALQDPAFKDMSLSQKSQILLSSTDPKGLLTPEKLKPFLPTPLSLQADTLASVGAIDARTATVNKPDITKNNDGTWKNKVTGQSGFIVDGKRVDKDGKEVK